jgi:hypothetical protein
MTSLFETIASYDPEYRRRHAAEQATIDSQTDLLNEIKGLRRDIANANFVISERLAEAILNSVERLA